MERPTIEVKLTRPLVDEAKERTLDVLTIREPNLRDLRMADAAAKKGGQVELGRQLLAQVTGVLPPVLDRMSIPDFNAASAALAKLMGKDDDGAEDGEAGGAAGGF